MANRFFQQFQGSLQKKVVSLYAKVTFDTSGVAFVETSEQILAGSNPTTINPSSGFVGGTITAVDPGTGAFYYKFNLQDPYVRLLSVSATPTSVTTSTGELVVSAAVQDDQVNSQTAPYLSLNFVTINTGSNATTVGGKPDDSVVLLRVDLSNTTAP
jgi:hypothetical protein